MTIKQYTVKASGVDVSGKKEWSIWDNESKSFNTNFAGGRFDLQTVSAMLNSGHLSALTTMEELVTALPCKIKGEHATLVDLIADVEEHFNVIGDSAELSEDDTELKAYLRVLNTVKNIQLPMVDDSPALIGYMRISTTKTEQKFDRQETQLQDLGCSKIYSDKVSGTKKDRAGLADLIDNLKAGDTVIIVSIDRLSRSTKDLLEIVEVIKSKGAYLKSINDSWLDTTEASPMADFLLTVMGALGQMEREMIVHRVHEGLAVAKKKGVKFGRPRKNPKKIDHAIELYNSGKYITKEICEITGVSKATFYRRLKEIKEAD